MCQPDEIEITDAMVEAGVSVLRELEGEALLERQAREVFLAMAAARSIPVPPTCT